MAEQVARSVADIVHRPCSPVSVPDWARRDDVLALPWTDVDLDAGIITIAAERMKAGEELVRPITREMRRILEEQHKMNPDTYWVSLRT